MNSLVLPIGALILSIYLCIKYFTKKHINNKETKIYSIMLIVNLIFDILCITCVLIAKLTYNNDFLVGIFQKIYMLSLLLLVVYIVIYCFSIMNITDKVLSKIKLFFACIFIVISIFVMYFPIDVINKGDTLDGSGMAYNVVLIALAFLFLLITVLSIILVSNDRKNINKSIPFVILVVLYMLGFVLRLFIPSLMFENFFFAFMLIVMSDTIENPDLKMISQLEIARDQAEKANRAKSDFLSSMIHEIRTPLNAIVGFSEDIVSHKDSVEPIIAEDANYILEASNTLLEIVGNILDISKIESDKMQIVETIYNPKEIITKLARINATRIGDKDINFNLSIAEDLPNELIGDKLHIKQVINNLLTNAIKYTEKGSITLDVKCVNQGDLCNIILSVQDTGRGIKAENINKLFTKFERLDIEKNSTTEGTGLGLAITKKLVEMMGGTINVQSRYGFGSIFVVQIPQKINMQASVNISKMEIPLYHSEFDYSQKRVLIVDDNNLNIKVAKRALDYLHCIIDTAGSGQECLDKIVIGNEYDFILMDIMMPVMSGETVLKKLKEKANFNIPVIALTADAVAGAREKYISEGFDDYIAKPFTKEQIKEKIDMLIMSKK